MLFRRQQQDSLDHYQQLLPPDPCFSQVCYWRLNESLATSYFTIGTTKLAGYSLCLSVIASVIPKSKKTALATILPPMELGIEANPSLPSSVLQRSTKLSSLRRIKGELGIGAFIAILLFEISHEPELPSLNDIAIGTKASFVIEAQEDSINDVIKRSKLLRIDLSLNMFAV